MKSKHKILLVEDSLEDVKLTKLAFAKSEIPVVIDDVYNGEECIKYLMKEYPYENVDTPDLILLDLNMPKVDGKQVLERIKTNEILKKVPIIVLTTSTDKRDVQGCYNLQANSYINKPMDFTEFLSLVKEIDKYWLQVVELPNE